jgi:hypothetical protein
MARPKENEEILDVLKTKEINKPEEVLSEKETQKDFSLFDKPEEVALEIVNNLELPSEVFNKAVKPIKHIFQIKATPGENEMYNGAHLPGNKIGVSKFSFTYIVRDLNEDVRNKEAYNAFTGLEVDHLDMNDNIPEEEKTRLYKEARIAKAYIEKKTNQSADPTNISFWSSKTLKITDLGLVHDTTESLDSLIWYHIIQAGGVQEIARNYEDAIANEKKLYMSIENEAIQRDFEDKKYKLEAFAVLDEIYKKWSTEDVLFFTYLVSKRQHGFTKNTSRELIVNELEEFVEGVGLKMDKKKRPAEFIKLVNFFKNNKDAAKVKGLFNAAVYYGFIGRNGKMEYYNKDTGFLYGSVEETASEKLMDVRNKEEFISINKKVNDKWVR